MSDSQRCGDALRLDARSSVRVVRVHAPAERDDGPLREPRLIVRALTSDRQTSQDVSSHPLPLGPCVDRLPMARLWLLWKERPSTLDPPHTTREAPRRGQPHRPPPVQHRLFLHRMYARIPVGFSSIGDRSSIGDSGDAQR